MKNTLKQGNPFPIIFNCKDCGCIFEADRNSYILQKGLFYIRFHDICPSCGQFTEVRMSRKQFKKCK